MPVKAASVRTLLKKTRGIRGGFDGFSEILGVKVSVASMFIA